MGLEVSLWRAVAVFRFAALAYAVVLLATGRGEYLRPWLGLGVVVVMLIWSIVAAVAYADPARRRWPLLSADMLVTLGCLFASSWVVDPARLSKGAATLPMAWVAGAVLAWAIAGGRRWGLFAALLVGAVDLTLRGQVTPTTLNGTVLLLLAGFSIGYLVRLAGEAELRLQHAAEMEAATRERERLARGIHDSVLQVLALVQRRGAEIGGEAAELGRLAGEQEEVLRSLVGDTPVRPRSSNGNCDLKALLAPKASNRVTVSGPATPVWLPERTAEEVAAATASALDNVLRHGGSEARAWVLVEEEESEVVVTVRDDGAGIVPGRLAEAAAAGRLGVAQSIEGRVRDLGGTTVITSAPGEGTEVEMRIPR
ncbi:MAG: sensor histidine kinase [Hamadaea sp.]|nr:sensor histidine kinase [Hamadaea sp.]NUT06109.1 sensor histidine kinase [Hamadaea sp.]